MVLNIFKSGLRPISIFDEWAISRSNLHALCQKSRALQAHVRTGTVEPFGVLGEVMKIRHFVAKIYIYVHV